MDITKATLFTKPVTFFERKKPITPKFGKGHQGRKESSRKFHEVSLKTKEIIDGDSMKESPIPSDNKNSTLSNNSHIITRPVRLRILQNFSLIWLDPTMNETDPDYKCSLKLLQRIINVTNIFRDVQRCIDFLCQIKDVKVFMVIPYSLAQSILPLIHGVPQLDAIYVLATYSSEHEHWASEWGKIKGIFVRIDSIIEALKHDIQQCNRDSISISVTSKDLSRLDPSFMYTQLLKEILLEMSHHDKEKIELAEFCRQQYLENQYELQIINEFERDYHVHTPIWWYTRESFAYHMLNQALRIEDIEIIIKMGFFLQDLHQQIKELHSKAEHKSSFTVYRGQGMLNEDFQKIRRSEYGLLAFNSFLSTSLNESISLDFACAALHKPESVGILFRMTINPSISSTPFAYVGNNGFYNDSEKEVLFSMHTIFRIGQIVSIQDRVWCVDLSSASEDDDQELKRLTGYIRKEIHGRTSWHQLSKLLIKAGSFDKAEEICVMLLNETSKDDTDELAILNFQLAFVKKNQRSYDEAFEYYQRSLDMRQNTLDRNDPDLAETYYEMGSLYDHKGEFSKALDFYNKSIQTWRNITPTNHSKLASIYTSTGTVHMNINEYSKGLEYYKNSLKHEQKSLPLNYSKLASAYSNIGIIYKNMTQYTNALEYFLKALKASEQAPTLSRPWVSNIYKNIALLHKNMGDYPKALEFSHKMLQFQQGYIPPRHPALGDTYCQIALMHYNMQEYSQALDYYFKALDMYQGNIPRHNLSFGIIYNQIGQVFDKMGDYAKAVSFYEQAVEVGQHSSSENDSYLQSWSRKLAISQQKKNNLA